MLNQARQLDLIEDIVIVGLDPDISFFQQQDRQILTSIQVVEKFQPVKPHQKLIEMADGRFLKLGFNEKNYLPIIDIDNFEKCQDAWKPITTPMVYQIFTEHLHIKTSKNWFSQKFIANVTIMRGGVQCCFYQEEQKSLNKIVKIPYTQDYLVIEFHQVKPITSYAFKPFVIQQHPINKKRNYLINIPLFSFPSGIKLSENLQPYKIHTFILTQDQGTKLYCTCLTAMDQCQLFQNYIHNQIFQPKGYVIVSKHQHTDCFIQFLQHLYVELSTKQVSLSKLAKRAWQQFSNYELNYQSLTIQYPSVSQRPLGCLFRMLSVNNIVKIFKALLLQKNVFFVSDSKMILGFMIESFLSLLYPLNWQHPVIPILHDEISSDFLDSPIPTIIGILTENFEKEFEQFGLIVYVDKNQLANTKIVDSFMSLQDRILQRRLQKYSIHVPGAAQQFFISQQNPSFFRKSNIEQKFNIAKFRTIFLKYMHQLLKNYKEYIVIEQDNVYKGRQSLQTRASQTRCFRQMFRIKQYKAKIKIQGKQYLEHFIETALFTTFVERNCINPEDPHLIFFNESIQTKDTKKYQMITKKTIAQQTIETATHRLFRNSKTKVNQMKRARSTQQLHPKNQVTERISDYIFLQNRTRLLSNQNINQKFPKFFYEDDLKIDQIIMESRKTRFTKFREITYNDFDESCISIDDNLLEKSSLQDYLSEHQFQQKKMFGQNLCNMISRFSSCIFVSGSNIFKWAKKSYKKLGNKKQLMIEHSTLTESFVQEQ